VTPAEIAAEITSALQDVDGVPRRLLQEALDALSDGLPAEHVETIVRLALRSLDAGRSG
jgi:hypothetical protein